MDTQIYITTLKEARKDGKLIRNLYALTLRGESAMRDELNMVCLDDYAEKYKLVIAKNENKIVGWSMIMPYSDEYFPHINLAYFYVARSYRRNGIGTKLYNTAQKQCDETEKKMYCVPWDEISTRFFTKNKAKIL